MRVSFFTLTILAVITLFASGSVVQDSLTTTKELEADRLQAMIASPRENGPIAKFLNSSITGACGCDTAPCVFCCHTGTPCDCSQPAGAPNCEQSAFLYCCGWGTPCSCS
eukprot:m.24994 g.24994  ORF g.24994 m.24994 type:complete len:110 (+) comp14835_c0_seq1:102-431(+)